VIHFSTRYTGTRFRMVAEGLGAAHDVAVVYLDQPRIQAQKIDTITGAGHISPMSVPRSKRRWITEYMRLAILHGGARHVSKAMRDSSTLLRDWLKTRLITGRLGTQSPVTRKIKCWLIDHGRISGRYGYPPPLGIRSGNLLHSIRARMERRSRGG